MRRPRALARAGGVTTPCGDLSGSGSRSAWVERPRSQPVRPSSDQGRLSCDAAKRPGLWRGGEAASDRRLHKEERGRDRREIPLPVLHLRSHHGRHPLRLRSRYAGTYAGTYVRRCGGVKVRRLRYLLMYVLATPLTPLTTPLTTRLPTPLTAPLTTPLTTRLLRDRLVEELELRRHEIAMGDRIVGGLHAWLVVSK